MKTISVIRRENLLKLEEKYDGLGQLNEKIGRDRSDSTLRQIRSRVRLKNGYSREMGDAVARELEEKLQLEIGWMDHSHGGTEEEEAARRSLTVLPIKRGVTYADDLLFEPDKKANPSALYIPITWISQKGLTSTNLMALRVDGDWMAPEIQKGSVVVVALDRTEVVTTGVYVIRYRSEVRVCRLEKLLDGTIMIRYSAGTGSGSDEKVVPGLPSQIFKIIGLVVSVDHRQDLV